MCLKIIYIYAFMVLKEERVDVLDIIDLSEFRRTTLELKSQLISIFAFE